MATISIIIKQYNKTRHSIRSQNVSDVRVRRGGPHLPLLLGGNDVGEAHAHLVSSFHSSFHSHPTLLRRCRSAWAPLPPRAHPCGRGHVGPWPTHGADCDSRLLWIRPPLVPSPRHSTSMPVSSLMRIGFYSLCMN